MTAGRIASRLGEKYVHINYRASEIISEFHRGTGGKKFESNPMGKLEYCKNGCNYSNMTASNMKYTTPDYFPGGVYFKEPPADAETEKIKR